MKNLLLLVLTISFTFLSIQNTEAQSRKKKSKSGFQIENLFGGGNLAFAKPIGDFNQYAKGGFSYNIVVGYKLTEKLGVGIEYGSALTAAIDTAASGLFGVNLYGLNSYLAKGWYRFTEGKIRPYAAIGLGLARVQEPDLTIGTETVLGAKRSGFGANAELGVNILGVNLSYSFNLSGRSPEEPVINGAADLAVNYHRFAIGYIVNF